MLSLRQPQAIALDLFGCNQLPALQPDHRFAAQEISGDCVFLNAQQARNETQHRDAPQAGLGNHWWVFAVSGTGDAWLISADDQQSIAFLNHDLGPDATAEPMALNFGQWLQLADLLRQWEQSTDDCEPAEQAELQVLMIQLLDQISPGLSQRLPYAL